MAFAEARATVPYFWYFDSREYGKELTGVFLGRENLYGDNYRLMFRLDNGETVYIWETKLLKAKLAGIPRGKLVMIVWKGLKAGKNYDYHEYDVFEYVEEDDDFIEVI